MKYLIALLFWITILAAPAYAQDYRKHTVAKGETVTSIAQKYKVTPYDILRLNPDAKNGLQESSILLIPGLAAKPLTPAKEQPTKVTNTIHEVQPKETVYSISKKYGVTEADLQKANADLLKDGLKAGQQLVIPVKGSGVAAQVKIAEKQETKKNEPSYFYHVVEAGETKYGIAKKYGMSLQLLEELNPEVKDTLPLGFKLKLDKRSAITEAEQTSKPAAPAKFTEYTVQPKETFYSIGKATGLTEAEIVALNPEAKDGLKDGMVLKLPAGSAGTIVTAAPGKSVSLALDKSEPKKMAMLIPFYLTRVENDTVKSKLLRTDKFLNITLDFYAGALIAIDSAKTLGLPLEVIILDSKETAKSSDVGALKGKLTGADAIVGPFFQNNVESAAAMMGSIPVISPLSKEQGKPYANLYQSVPPADVQRKTLLDYITSKNANVIAITDSKKASSRDFIKAEYPSVKILDGGITSDKIRALLVAGKTNYVFLDTESITTINGTTKLLAEAQATFDIQLAVTEITDKYDNDEVPLARLVGLKTLYASAANDSQTDKQALFIKKFREVNNYEPSQYAIRGFDVTFDVITRLFQKDDFTTVQQTLSSEQVENKFTYTKINGGNYNTGVYIMQYSEGLTVKQAQ